MLKLLLIFSIFILEINAFEIRSWNLLRISEKTVLKKDTNFIKTYVDEEYDVMCVQEVMSLNSLKHISDTKSIYYSNIKSGRKTYKEYLGWFIDARYQNVEVIDYYDTKDVFERDPSMLILKDVNIGIINYHAIYGQKKSKKNTGNKWTYTLNEAANIPNLFKYFSMKSGIPQERLFMCGDFNLSQGKLKSKIPGMKIGNNEGSTVSTKYGYTNNDYDHIISYFDGKIAPDYKILEKFEGNFKQFKKKVSDHVPIKGIY